MKLLTLSVSETSLHGVIGSKISQKLLLFRGDRRGDMEGLIALPTTRSSDQSRLASGRVEALRALLGLLPLDRAADKSPPLRSSFREDELEDDARKRKDIGEGSRRIAPSTTVAAATLSPVSAPRCCAVSGGCCGAEPCRFDLVVLKMGG